MIGVPARTWVTVRTLAAGIAGGWVFSLLHLPAPWLSGPMTAVAALAMSGRSLHLPLLLCDTGLFLAGLSLGSTVTPEALSTIPSYLFSIAGLLLCVASIVVISTRLLESVFGWDRQTAFLSSVPGALTMTMALVAQTGADASRVTVVQVLRLFVLVALLPIMIGGSAIGGGTQQMMSAPSMALLCGVGLALDVLLRRIGTITPLFLGGMIASTMLHLAGWAPGVLPAPVATVGFVLIGVFCGLRFEGTTLRMVGQVFLPALVSLAVTLGASFATAWLIARLAGVPLPEALVAMAPGGVEAMTLVGASLGLDTLYIGTHHVVRLFMLNGLTPFFLPRGAVSRD